MNKWPDETKSYAFELRRQGEMVKDIARAIGKSRKAVEAWFIRQSRLDGIPPKPCRKGIPIFWTQDKIETVFKHITEGRSRQHTADLMGVTKSAVTGAIDRLRMAGVRVPVPPTVFKTRRPPAKRTEKPAGSVSAPKVRAIPVGPGTAPVPLMGRTGCAFPVNNGGPFLFCNKATDSGKSYCHFHGHVMYNHPA